MTSLALPLPVPTTEPWPAFPHGAGRCLSELCDIKLSKMA